MPIFMKKAHVQKKLYMGLSFDLSQAAAEHSGMFDLTHKGVPILPHDHEPNHEYHNQQKILYHILAGVSMC